MDGIPSLLLGGFLLGFAGSLHCACMCGAIASGALFILNPATPRERLTALLWLQAGRITTYAMTGGLVAGVSSLAVDPDATAFSFRALQWLAAAALMWLGLSTAGMTPRLAAYPAVSAGLSRMRAQVFDAVLPSLAPLRHARRLGPIGMGLGWGLTPCPMVYAALFSAALTGSFVSGALWMLSFGAGALPGVILAALGIAKLSVVGRSQAARIASGLLIATLGVASIYFGWPLSGLYCATN